MEPVDILIESAKDPGDDRFRVTGIAMQYYAICKRELWFYLHGVDIDRNNKAIQNGIRVDKSFSKNQTDLRFGMIAPDLMDNGMVAEVKPSNNELADGRELQLHYYLWYFKHILESPRSGVLIYPKQHRRETVVLNDEIERKVEYSIRGIYEIKQMDDPPELESKPFCESCAYYDFCWV